MSVITDSRQFKKVEDITPDSVNQRFHRLYESFNYWDVVSVTAAYTAKVSDDVILGDASGGNFSITLPPAANIRGRRYWIKSVSTGTVTIDGNASETIDGATTVALSTQYHFRGIISNGTNWSVISS